MNTATPRMTETKGDVTQTTYELSEPIGYTRWNGDKRKTRVIIVSHARYNGATETAVFPGTLSGEVMTYSDLYMTSPACDNVTALEALGLTLGPPLVPGARF